MNLGEKLRNETFRLYLSLDAAPSADPTVKIERQGTLVLAETAMLVLAGTLNRVWYYDYTTGSSAPVGAHQVAYKGVLGSITEYDHDSYDQTIDDFDSLATAVSALPTAAEIDTELSTNHGAGQWGGTAGAGAYNATINVQDDTPVDVADAYVTIHNAADDDGPIVAAGTTDLNGNVTLNLQGNVYIRVKKAGLVFTSTAKNITASGTYNVTGTALVISPPANPDTSNCYIAVYDLAGVVVTSGITLTITKHDDITKDVNDNFITNTGVDMVYHAGSGTWQAAIVKGTHVNIKSIKVLGVDDNGDLIDRNFTVGTGATTNLGDIYLS
ncbi:MAG: hypothetical protein KAS66_00220 [Candidatus Omnitrophica bacterium]|nr:hypothetical protein [Candidatus Omnitrophota bacterium]